jgi:hypothetical protein
MCHTIHGEGVEPDFLGHDGRRNSLLISPGLVARGWGEVVPIGHALARQIRTASGADLTFAAASPRNLDANVKSEAPLETIIC